MKKRWQAECGRGYLALAALLVVAPARADVTLVADGQPRAAIVLAERPTRSAQLAARELQEHVRLISDAVLPIVAEGAYTPAAGLPVYVGESGAARLAGLTSRDFAPQESLVRVTPRAVFLIGRDDPDFGPLAYESLGAWSGFSFACRVGSLYAVYDLLERDLGVRWYMVTDLGRVVPRRPTLRIETQETRRRPWCLHRHPGYPSWPDPTDIGESDIGGMRRFKRYVAPRDSTLFALRTRYGGEPYEANHSVYGYHARFAGLHPDWWVDGVPAPHKQLRYDHTGVVAQVTADALAYFAKPYAERQHGIRGVAGAAGDYFGVAPLDNRDYGPACKPPLDPERRGPGFGSGEASNYIFTWVNRVAEAVGAVFPDAWISTIAYAGMFMPPGFDMQPNVAVTVCNAEADAWNPAGFGMQTLREWRRRVSRVCLWDYVHETGANGRFPPFLPRAFADYAAQLRDLGVWGVTLGVSNPSPPIWHLDYTLMMKGLTDPAADAGAILDEYYRLFYGPAAKPMREFWTSLQQAAGEVYAQPLSRTRSWCRAATDARLKAWRRWMEKADGAAAGREPFAARVALIRHGVLEVIETEAAQQKQIEQSPLPRLVLPRAPAPPELDGKPDESTWSTAARTAVFTGLRGEKLLTRTTASLAYDDRNLYIAMRMEEPRMSEQTLVQASSTGGLSEDDSIEINLDPTPETDDYIQIMMNANSVMWVWWRGKHKPNLTPDLAIRGRAWRGEKEWTCELVVPFEKIAARPPASGEPWTLNCLRNRCLPDTNSRHKPDRYAIWAIPFTWSFHVKERFGTIVFGATPAFSAVGAPIAGDGENSP